MTCQDRNQEGDDACRDACERRLIDRQPATTTDFIRAVFYAVVPVCQALCALHIFLFPICGERLALCVKRQAETADASPG